MSPQDKREQDDINLILFFMDHVEKEVRLHVDFNDENRDVVKPFATLIEFDYDGEEIPQTFSGKTRNGPCEKNGTKDCCKPMRDKKCPAECPLTFILSYTATLEWATISRGNKNPGSCAKYFIKDML